MGRARWDRRRLPLALLAAAGLVGLGIWLERRAERRLVGGHTGRLIDVDGHAMHIVALGEKRPGQPTVVLEAGHADFSMCWRAVQPEVAKFARVVAYDRAGYGWSEPGPLPRSPRRIVEELHTLLRLAGETPPYLLVGHSLGGPYNRLFASLYPDEVAGMVWVDSAHEDMLRYLPFWPLAYNGLLAGAGGASLLARAGLVRLVDRWGVLRLLPGIVEPLDLGPAAAHHVTPGYFTTLREEARAWYQQANWQHSRPYFGDLPLLMFEAQYTPNPPAGFPPRQWREYMQGWRAIQDDLSRMVTRARRVPVASAHQIQLEQPGLVVQGIKEMLEALAQE